MFRRHCYCPVFPGDLKQLLLGVNLGGLGTLIASMASLISYKIYAHNYNRTKGYYLLWFHLANIHFSRGTCAACAGNVVKMGGRIKCRKNN